MTEVTAQALADHYVSLVGEDIEGGYDLTAANEWANTLVGKVEKEMLEEASVISANMLQEQHPEAKVVEATESVTTQGTIEAVETPVEDEKPADNA